MNAQSMVDCAFEVAQDSFNRTPMVDCRLVHKLRDFVDNIRKIMSSNRGVLENPTTLRYKWPSSKRALSFKKREVLAAMGVLHGLALCILVRTSKSVMYLACEVQPI